MTAIEKAAITKRVLGFVTQSGVQVIALTFDGHSSNIAMGRELSADISINGAEFEHPTENHKVHIFLDASHMLKLIRNCLASKRILHDGNGNEIKWEYLEKLVLLQERGHFHLANKTTKKHIYWQHNKMNVKLAAQTFSNSAVALEQLLHDGHKDFMGCAPTIVFIKMINDVFDYLNSRSLYARGCKKAITPDTAQDIFQFFSKSITYTYI